MIQQGDRVRLVSLQAQTCESYFSGERGWLSGELPEPQIGDTFKVMALHGLWLELEGMYYLHPASKFEKVVETDTLNQ
jgi:hypothetical protein